MQEKISIRPSIALLISGIAVLITAAALKPEIFSLPRISLTMEKRNPTPSANISESPPPSASQPAPQPSPQPTTQVPLSADSGDQFQIQPSPESSQPKTDCVEGNPMRTQAIRSRELADIAYSQEKNLPKTLELYQQSQQEFRMARCFQAAEQVQIGIDKVRQQMESAQPSISSEPYAHQDCVPGNPNRTQAIRTRELADIAYDQEHDLNKALELYKKAQREFWVANCFEAAEQVQIGIDQVRYELRAIAPAKETDTQHLSKNNRAITIAEDSML